MPDQTERPHGGNPNWVKGGASPNPNGRSRGFRGVAKLIAEATRDGAELVEWAVAVWKDPERTHAERAAAHQWLSDRYLGKPLSSHEIVAAVTTTQLGPPPGWELMGPSERAAILDGGRQPMLALPAVDDGD